MLRLNLGRMSCVPGKWEVRPVHINVERMKLKVQTWFSVFWPILLYNCITKYIVFNI
jgi:hypothetical protein